MSKKEPQHDESDALEEALASFACEGIHFTDEEKVFLRRLHAEGLSDEEFAARVDSYLRETGQR